MRIATRNGAAFHAGEAINLEVRYENTGDDAFFLYRAPRCRSGCSRHSGTAGRDSRRTAVAAVFEYGVERRASSGSALLEHRALSY